MSDLVDRLPGLGGPRGHRPGPPRAGAVGLVLGVLFVLLVAGVAARHGAPLGPDLPLHDWAVRHRQPTVTSAAAVLTTTGTGVPAYLVTALAGAAGRRGWPARWRGCALTVLALAAGQLVRAALVLAVGRPRPPATDWAWHAGGAALPSGHTTTSALVAAIVCLAVRRSTARPRARAA